ncbi:hypothetical protein ACIA6C_15950 [Streptomyces sp. NPDC051578]|uniref:hypothetical protein n=1 Tax=Streptomyces sp. NPDC051578 TaxID=3365662 RepID=UPI0037B5A2A3
MIGTRHGTIVVVQDVREVPEEHQGVINDAMNDRMEAALHTGWGEPGPAPIQRGSVALTTQKFRAAVAANSAWHGPSALAGALERQAAPDPGEKP